jgi:hypothetical protein
MTKDEYIHTMAARDRLLTVHKEGRVIVALTFFVLPDMETAYKFHRVKKDWEAPPDLDFGSVIYIDHMEAYEWNPTIRRMVQHEIQTRFPSVETAIWFRPYGKRDRRVVAWRREILNGAEV